MKTFEKRVLEIVKQIPSGKVTTYGLIAEAAGNRSGARMVGWILNRQKFNREIPAHRVVNRHGRLTGKWHFETPSLMQKLLEAEGISVINDQVVNWEKYLWKPSFKF